MRPWWRRRWVVAVAAVLTLSIAVRATLPLVVRKILVAQGNARIAGRFDVANVDLWLLSGAIAIEGIEIAGERGAAPAAPLASAAPAPTAGAAAPAPGAPRVALRRLLVDIRWLPLLHHTIELDEIALEGLELDTERTADGALLLPALRPAAAAAAAAPAPAEKAPEERSQPWNVIVDDARLEGGKLVLVDRVPDPAETVAVTLDGFRLRGFHLLRDGAGEPGTGTIEAHFGDGSLRLRTSVTTRSDGFALAANLDLENLPLDRLNTHVPQLGWRAFRGRLDASLEARAEPNALPVVSGTLALRDVRVDVPGEDEAALAWRRLDVDLEQLDVERRQAKVRRVALEGAGILVRPRAAVPLPALPRPSERSSAGRRARVAVTTPGAPASTPWIWSVGTVEVEDSMAKVFLEPPPLEIAIPRVKIEGLSSTAGSRATVALDVREGAGDVTLDGDLALDPLAAKLHLTMDGIALERLAAALGVTPPVLRHGSLSGDLDLALGDGPATVSGKIALADLDVAPPDGEDFGLAWKRLEVALREARLPGVPPPPGGGAVGPITVDLERVALSEPKLRLTRVADGVVLPAVTIASGGGDTAAGAAAAAPAESPTPDTAGAALEAPAASPAAADAAAPTPAPTPATPALQLSLGELSVDGGEVAVVDRTVKPFYRGRLSSIALAVHGLEYPAYRFRDLRLTAEAPGGTPLELRARQKGATIDAEASAERLALPQLNPYVVGASGYSITSGTFTMDTKLHLGKDGYDSDSSLAFDDLDVAGAEGDTLFAQRFGVSLSLALALLRDVSGRISLDVPISGDRAGGARPDLAPIVSEALAHALVNALASPLKLLGALSMDGDKVAAFAPEPIGFVAGQAKIDDASWWRVDQLAGVAAASPALRIELTGAAGASDARALAEAAVLADLQADQGVLATLRNLRSRGTRNAVRDALAARARGEAATLDPDDAAKLEEWVAEKSIPEERLRALAGERQAKLRDVLVEQYGFPADRVRLADPAVDGAADTTVVRVGIGARG